MDFITDPGETLLALGNAVLHPVKTYDAVSARIEETYQKDMVNGDAYSRSRWVTYAIGSASCGCVGTKGAGAINKADAAGKVINKAGQAGKKIKDVKLPELLSFITLNMILLCRVTYHTMWLTAKTLKINY